MTKTICALALAIGVAGTPELAEASPTTWLLEGNVSVSTVPGIVAGDAASMSLTFESSATDIEPDPNCGLYVAAILAASATFGSQTYAWIGGSNRIEISTGAGSVVACGITPGNFASYGRRVDLRSRAARHTSNGKARTM